MFIEFNWRKWSLRGHCSTSIVTSWSQTTPKLANSLIRCCVKPQSKLSSTTSTYETSASTRQFECALFILDLYFYIRYQIYIIYSIFILHVYFIGFHTLFSLFSLAWLDNNCLTKNSLTLCCLNTTAQQYNKTCYYRYHTVAVNALFNL